MPGPRPSRNLNDFAFKDDPLSCDVFGLFVPLQAPSFPTSEFDTFFSEIPLDTPTAPSVTQDISHSNQTPDEVSKFQPRTTTPHNTVSLLFFVEFVTLKCLILQLSTASRGDVAEVEAWFAGITQSPGGFLPILSPVRLLSAFSFKCLLTWKTNTAGPIFAPGCSLPI